MARMDGIVAMASSETATGSGTHYIVETTAGVLYVFYITPSTFDLYYKKSTDNGLSWSQPVAIITTSIQTMAVYADWWAGVAGTKIRMWYTDDSIGDILYRDLDTASDTLGTQRTVFLGASAVLTGSHLTGCVARSGYLFCRGCIDGGAEGGFYRSTDDGVTWTSVPPAINEALATQDRGILLPGWNADTNDVQLIFFDSSAQELSVQRYDNSLDTWSEASLGLSITMPNGVIDFAAVADLTNSRNVVVTWTSVDTASAVLKCWTVDDTTVTPKTAVVASSTDDQGYAALTIDASNNWTVYYAGITTGGETWTTSLKIYCKVSSDSGSTWGSETVLSTYTLTAPYTQSISSLWSIPKAYTKTSSDNPIYFYENTAPTSTKFNAVVPTAGGSASGVRNPLMGPIG